jgi:polysaccharide chain length determinant protein (PEP-CTERM system associated)
MPETEKPFDIFQYLEIALRRKWYIIIPLVASLVGSFGVYKYLPKFYRATTLILVQPQRVPETYVRTTVTESVADRLSTISQEILSRSRLEKIIEEFNLYREHRQKMHMEDIVEMMKKAIDIKVRGGGIQNAFTISFEDREPRTVMLVTNKLASLFIEENLKARELRAESTAEFISKELEALEDDLKKKEQELRYYKERHMGQLPQQLEPNLRTLERLQQQLKATRESIRALEERNAITQNMIEELKKIETVVDAIRPRKESPARKLETRSELPLGLENEKTYEDPIIRQYDLLKRELAAARTRYTENHPDVISIKRKLSNLETRLKEIAEKQEELREARLKESRERQEKAVVDDLPSPSSSLTGPDPGTERLRVQYSEQHNEALSEIKRLKEEERTLKEQIAIYHRRVEDTPKREQELSTLTRDYDRLMANYQSLLDKKIQAQMAENLERKQQGEHFKILDLARIPETPARPNRAKILLMGGVLGLGLGLGLAWFRESMDQSFHTVSDMESYLGITVLATIPNLKEEEKKAA